MRRSLWEWQKLKQKQKQKPQLPLSMPAEQIVRSPIPSWITENTGLLSFPMNPTLKFLRTGKAFAMHRLIDPAILDVVLTCLSMLIIAGVITAVAVSFDPHIDRK